MTPLPQSKLSILLRMVAKLLVFNPTSSGQPVIPSNTSIVHYSQSFGGFKNKTFANLEKTLSSSFTTQHRIYLSANHFAKLSTKNLGRLWLAYTELQGEFYMLQLISVDSRHFTLYTTLWYHQMLERTMGNYQLKLPYILCSAT